VLIQVTEDHLNLAEASGRPDLAVDFAMAEALKHNIVVGFTTWHRKGSHERNPLPPEATEWMWGVMRGERSPEPFSFELAVPLAAKRKGEAL